METVLEFLVKIDQTMFFLINGGVGKYNFLDSAARIIASDYLIHVSFSLVPVVEEPPIQLPSKGIKTKD